jgi:hypothetical protein
MALNVGYDASDEQVTAIAQRHLPQNARDALGDKGLAAISKDITDALSYNPSRGGQSR